MIKAINKYGYYSPKLSLEKIHIWQHCFLWMVVSISLICAVQSTPTCNSFPKIFGSSYGATFLRHIDAFDDYLALAGDTNDNGLTGITSAIPYLALASISRGGKYYWAKALSLKTTTGFQAV
jgi:hypothetical protein